MALDVAYGELDWRLRNDERVTVIERDNARNVVIRDLPYAPDLVVIDVSFISLTKVLPAVLACCAAEHDVLAMVKPQFEVGRARIGKGGVVRDAADRREALVRWPGRRGRWARPCSASPRPGCPGRRATVRASSGSPRPAAPGDVGDLEAAAREVEPCDRAARTATVLTHTRPRAGGRGARRV